LFTWYRLSGASTVTASTSSSTSSNTSSEPESFTSKMKRIRYLFGLVFRLCTQLLCRMAAQEDLLADSVFEDDTVAGIVDVECLR